MKSLSFEIAQFLEMHNIIQENEIDKCRYGLDILISSLLEIISIVILSFFIKNFIQTIFFFISFIPLRIFAGGYHANTKIGCYIISIIVYMIFSRCLNIIPLSQYKLICFISCFYSLILVCFFSPIIHSNKNVNNAEIKKFRKISIIICMIQIVAILFFMYISPNTLLFVALPMALGQMAETLSMTIVVFQKIKKGRRKLYDN